MSFMDILRKEISTSNTVLDTLVSYFNNYERIETVKLVKDISTVLNLAKQNMDGTEKSIFNEKIDFPFYKKIKVEKQFQYAFEELKKFFNSYQTFIRRHNKASIENDLLPAEWDNLKQQILELENTSTIEEADKWINGTVERLEKFMQLTSSKRNVFLDNDGDRNKQSIPFILESMLKKALNREEYTEDFGILKDRGLFGKNKLRKVAILISAIKSNKLIPPSRVKLENRNMIFTILKTDYISKGNVVKQGYKILKDILRTENILLPTSNDNNMLERFLTSYKSSPEIEQNLRRLKEIFRTPDASDDIAYFKDLTTFQNIIYKAEQMYADMDVGYDNFDDFYANVNTTDELKDFVESEQEKYGEETEEEETEYKESDLDAFVDDALDFKQFYGSLAWLVFTLEENQLIRRNEIKIDNKLLGILDLTKQELYDTYDETYGNINLKELTRGVTTASLNQEWMQDLQDKKNNSL